AATSTSTRANQDVRALMAAAPCRSSPCLYVVRALSHRAVVGAVGDPREQIGCHLGKPVERDRARHDEGGEDEQHERGSATPHAASQPNPTPPPAEGQKQTPRHRRDPRGDPETTG